MFSTSNAASAQLIYRRRKASGLCTASGCRAQAEPGRICCQSHLHLMSKNNKQRYRKRAHEAVCVYCGVRPQFWGVRCVVCRLRFTKDPLPFGARRALRLHREAERRREIEQLQIEARKAVCTMLSTRAVAGQAAEALWLYAGFDSGKWRTYKEVGDLMNLSKERVRQVLRPAKLILAQALDNNVPWRRNDGPRGDRRATHPRRRRSDQKSAREQ